MNRIEFKDLEVGVLYWYVEYQGDSKPESEVLVKILPPTSSGKILAVKVLTGETFETFEPLPIYAYFETVHPQYVETQIKALEAQQLRVAEQLAIYKSL